MFEVELKFSIPAEQPIELSERIRGGSERQSLQAIYFDTQYRRLADHQTSVRLRHEGNDWIQTVKAAGDSPARRVEHNVDRQRGVAKRGAPELNLELHDGTPAGTALRHALGHPAQALHEVFRTEVVRHKRTSRTLGSQVEIALDEGWIVAGSRRQPIHELEFELKSGAQAALFALARRWVKRHGLWIEGRSKAERGNWLVRGEAGAPPYKASEGHLDGVKEARDELELLRALVQAALQQVLANASEVASGQETPDHVHQLRVGLRRLRTALRAFGEVAPDLADYEVPIAEVFRALGRWRDAGVTEESIVPRLRDAGAPAVTLPETTEERLSPTTIVRGTALQLALLRLMEFAMVDQPNSDDSRVTSANGNDLAGLIDERLSKLHKQLRRDGRQFEKLPQVEQHRVRKRLKRLRYLAEFVAPRYKRRAVKRYLTTLEPAQDALGAHNDAVVALERYRLVAESDPRAWFAVGWLTALLDRTAIESKDALKAIDRVGRFWS